MSEAYREAASLGDLLALASLQHFCFQPLKAEELYALSAASSGLKPCPWEAHFYSADAL